MFPALNFWPALVWQPNTSNFWAAGVQCQFRGTSSWPPCPSCQPCQRRHTDELQAPGHLVDRAILGAQQHDRAKPAGAPAGANQQAAVALPCQDFDAVLNRVNELECTVQSLQSALVPPERPFSVRSRSRMVHLAQHDELSNPPTEWRSKCGWSYGVSNFYRITQVAPEHRRCKKCFNIPAEPGDDEQDSGSDSSGTSSSVESSEEVPS